MTAKTALCKALLLGEVLNVGNVFRNIGLTNCAREISRMIEKDFHVSVSRTPMKGNSRFGSECQWVNYRLNKSEHNLEGIQAMIKYVAEHDPSFNPESPRTEREQKEVNAIKITSQYASNLSNNKSFNAPTLFP